MILIPILIGAVTRLVRMLRRRRAASATPATDAGRI